MLKLDGYHVLEAENGLKAVDVLRKNPPDAVILDMMMPGMSGLEVLKFMQEDNHLRQIPVVVVSARGMLSDINKGISAGAVSYLPKPVSFMDLRREVKNALQKNN